jgi:15-cis-phytoene synthase
MNNVMRQHAKSFYWAARFLSKATRRDTETLYAFARHADDLADEPHLGPLPERLAALEALKQALNTPSEPRHPITLLRQHYAWPEHLLSSFLGSLIQDTQARCMRTEQELLTFAYGVAATMGLMMRPILGANSTADPYALALGLAMQLTNIARDVVEDGQRARTYIPASYGASHTDLCSPADEQAKERAFAAIAKVLALAEDFYSFSEQGLHHIPNPNQRAIQLALVLYRGIGRKILQRGQDQYWHGRVHLNVIEKIKLTWPLFINAQNPKTPTRAAPPAALAQLQHVK